jgi:DEAD/DEAH box helicase domain-containing protein
LSQLRLLCLDEAHAYHGVFGSHVGNVLRRLFRFAPAEVRMVLASATSANAAEHTLALTGRAASVLRSDAAPAPPRLHAIANPPLIDERLGVRADPLDEALLMGASLMRGGARGVIFVPSRMVAERAALRLKGMAPEVAAGVFAYRSGLLTKERREVEEALQSGAARAVVSTSALELGVDFGALDFVLHVGYPGSVAAYLQRAGRAGRERGGLSLLVAGAGSLDQYIVRHPEHLQGATEVLVADPDNLSILTDHVRCSLYEASFSHHDRSFPHLEEILELLAEDGEAVRTASRWRALALDRPAARVGLRALGRSVRAVNGGRVIATSAHSDAPWLWHPGAVYVHAGRHYVVAELDLDVDEARLVEGAAAWFTTSVTDRKAEVLDVLESRDVRGGTLRLVELKVSSRVTGFSCRSWESGERLGGESLDLPPTELVTIGVSFVLGAANEALPWGGDANDYGQEWLEVAARARRRDEGRCGICGAGSLGGRALDVHHVKPFRAFERREDANALENLVTLCPTCHKRAEAGIRIRSGVAALSNVLRGVLPAFLRCSASDVGVMSESPDGAAGFTLYDRAAGGVGLSVSYFGAHELVLAAARDVMRDCPCEAGCPGCVGPAALEGESGKSAAMEIVGALA